MMFQEKPHRCWLPAAHPDPLPGNVCKPGQPIDHSPKDTHVMLQENFSAAFENMIQ
jgi:hypothetical protein